MNQTGHGSAGASRPGRWLAARAGAALGLAALGLYVLSGFYVLGPEEAAVVERFGRPVNADRPSGPGLHYTWPWPIDRVRRVVTGRIQAMELGYKGRIDPEAILWTNIVYEEDRPMLTGHRVSAAGACLPVGRSSEPGPAGTGHEHMQVFVNARVVVLYRIAEPAAYLYGCEDPEGMLRALAERGMREEIGRRELFPMLSVERDRLQEAIYEAVGPGAARLGVAVEGVEIRDIHPPAPVASAFQDVVSAMEDYETLKTHGQGYRIDTVQQAQTRAAEVAAEAAGYALHTVAASRGEVAGYGARVAAYRDYGRVARLHLYLEAMGRALGPMRKVIVPAPGGEGGPEVWLLDSGLGGPGAAAGRPAGPPRRLPELPEKEL